MWMDGVWLRAVQLLYMPRRAHTPRARPPANRLPILDIPPPQVLKRLPNLKKLDGIPVDVDERDQALQARGGA